MTDHRSAPSLRRFLAVALLAAALAPASVRAQQPAMSPDEEITPRQVQTVPAARPKSGSRSVDPADTTSATAPAANPRMAAPKPGPATRTIACSGMFGKDASHIKLAEVVGANNIDYGAVSGQQGSSLNASILYGKDPKRRLEVLWQNEAARSDTALIVITGQSQWHAPKGLHLGLALAALEKLNGKPFRLSGFDQPDGSRAIDWQAGALASLPGGCQIGVKLKPDSKATPEALQAAAGKEFLSSDPAIRAVKPVIAEIVIGY
ncbi:MAG TPA: hypothetical protein VLX44_16660 [Xanthobacteraceae bacterium]|nr:hypothetical protein [Xanthobacteraceae bacterium]